MIGILIVGLHQGQRTYAPHRQAGHMTAADQIVRSAKIVLAREGRPHMRAVGVKSYFAAVWKFRLTSSRFLLRLAVSHGRGEADRVAQPPPWRFQVSGQTKYFSRLHDRDGGSRHATSRAVAATAHRADQINVQVSRACRQASVQSASLLSPRQPEPFLTCGLDTAEPHIRWPLIAVGTKIPHTRGHRARKERNQS